MKKTFSALSVCLVLASTSAILHAEGNAHAGKERAVSCANCHGENGNSAVGTFPKLAGQHVSYLTKQLQAFKNGTRKDSMMSAMVASLTEQDMLDIAEYYAQQKITENHNPSLPVDDDDEEKPAVEAGKEVTVEKLIAAGHQLYRNGDLTREVSACIACHGSHAEGNKPAAFPMLQSQQVDYLIKTLSDFKTSLRGNNPENPMHLIAKKMSDEEIKAVAYYLAYFKLTPQ